MRAAAVLPPRELENLRTYMLSLVREGRMPPRRGLASDWDAIAEKCNIDPDRLNEIKSVLKPGFDAIIRYLSKRQPDEKRRCKDTANRKATSRNKRASSIAPVKRSQKFGASSLSMNAEAIRRPSDRVPEARFSMCGEKGQKFSYTKAGLD